jgi:hypothetical protein
MSSLDKLIATVQPRPTHTSSRLLPASATASTTGVGHAATASSASAYPLPAAVEEARRVCVGLVLCCVAASGIW